VRIQGFGVWMGIACTLIFGTLNTILWVKTPAAQAGRAFADRGYAVPAFRR